MTSNKKIKIFIVISVLCLSNHTFAMDLQSQPAIPASDAAIATARDHIAGYLQLFKTAIEKNGEEKIINRAFQMAYRGIKKTQFISANEKQTALNKLLSMQLAHQSAPKRQRELNAIQEAREEEAKNKSLINNLLRERDAGQTVADEAQAHLAQQTEFAGEEAGPAPVEMMVENRQPVRGNGQGLQAQQQLDLQNKRKSAYAVAHRDANQINGQENEPDQQPKHNGKSKLSLKERLKLIVDLRTVGRGELASLVYEYLKELRLQRVCHPMLNNGFLGLQSAVATNAQGRPVIISCGLWDAQDKEHNGTIRVIDCLNYAPFAKGAVAKDSVKIHASAAAEIEFPNEDICSNFKRIHFFRNNNIPMVAAGLAHGGMLLYDFANNQGKECQQARNRRGNPVNAITAGVDEQGKSIVVTADENVLTVWDATDGSKKRTIELPGQGYCPTLYCCNDEQRRPIAVASHIVEGDNSYGTWTAWDLSTGQKKWESPTFSFYCNTVFERDEENKPMIVGASADRKKINIIDALSGAVKEFDMTYQAQADGNWRPGEQYISCLAIQKDSQGKLTLAIGQNQDWIEQRQRTRKGFWPWSNDQLINYDVITKYSSKLTLFDLGHATLNPVHTCGIHNCITAIGLGKNKWGETICAYATESPEALEIVWGPAGYSRLFTCSGKGNGAIYIFEPAAGKKHKFLNSISSHVTPITRIIITSDKQDCPVVICSDKCGSQYIYCPGTELPKLVDKYHAQNAEQSDCVIQ